MHLSNGILFNHESPRRGPTFVTRKVTRAVARIHKGLQQCLYMGNIDAKRDWGHARDYVEMMWMMMQKDTPDDYVVATGETNTVRTFIEYAFKVIGIEIGWKGSGVDEIGFDKANPSRELVKIDPKYFRPTEVELLIGTDEGEQKLGWTPKVKMEELCREMAEADIKLVRRDLTSTSNFLSTTAKGRPHHGTPPRLNRDADLTSRTTKDQPRNSLRAMNVLSRTRRAAAARAGERGARAARPGERTSARRSRRTTARRSQRRWRPKPTTRRRARTSRRSWSARRGAGAAGCCPTRRRSTRRRWSIHDGLSFAEHVLAPPRVEERCSSRWCRRWPTTGARASTTRPSCAPASTRTPPCSSSSGGATRRASARPTGRPTTASSRRRSSSGMGERDQLQLEREVSCLKRCHHAHIVTYHGAFAAEGTLHIITDTAAAARSPIGSRRTRRTARRLRRARRDVAPPARRRALARPRPVVAPRRQELKRLSPPPVRARRRRLTHRERGTRLVPPARPTPPPCPHAGMIFLGDFGRPTSSRVPTAPPTVSGGVCGADAVLPVAGGGDMWPTAPSDAGARGGVRAAHARRPRRRQRAAAADAPRPGRNPAPSTTPTPSSPAPPQRPRALRQDHRRGLLRPRRRPRRRPPPGPLLRALAADDAMLHPVTSQPAARPHRRLAHRRRPARPAAHPPAHHPAPRPSPPLIPLHPSGRDEALDPRRPPRLPRRRRL